MVIVQVTEAIRQQAKQMAEALHRKYVRRDNSIRSGAGHYYGKIGELVVVQRYGWKYCNTYDTDTITAEGHRVEIKTKQRSVEPRGNYLASVAMSNDRQDCTHYLFCSTIEDKVCYIIGIIPRHEFMDMAIIGKTGEIDPDSPKKAPWRYRADCRNIPYCKLRQIGDTPLRM